MIRKFILSVVAVLLFIGCFSQDSTQQSAIGFSQKDIKDLLHKHNNSVIDSSRPGKTKFLLVIPVVAANPTAGVMYGLGIAYTFKTNNGNTKLSTVNSNISNSTRGLVNVNIRSNLFTKNNQWFLNGDWRFLEGTEITYGLGTSANASSITHLNGYGFLNDKLGQSLKFKHVRFDQTLSKKLFTNFFAGIGFQYDRFYAVSDELTNAGDSLHSIQYQYSRSHGFNPTQYTVAGITANFLYDNRDNEVNTHRGYYANVNYTINQTALGSNINSQYLLAEYRSFYPLDKQERNVLAFWVYGNFLTNGKLPYLALPALGYDQRQRSGRGYTFGRFRGEDIIYEETEYRFPLSPHSGILGGVLFLNVTSVADKQNNVHVLNAAKIAYGTGLRVMLDKKSSTRLQLDIGMAQKSLGFYFGVQETF